MRRSSRRSCSGTGSAARSSWPTCGSASPMQSIAVAFDGRDTSRRALERATQFASVAGSTVHLIHASDDHEAGLKVVGVAEATLSMQRVAFVTHVEAGTPGEVVAR